MSTSNSGLAKTVMSVTAAATAGKVLVHSMANRASLQSLTASSIAANKSEYACSKCATKIIASSHAAPHCTSCGCSDVKKTKATASVPQNAGLVSVECRHCNSVHTMEPGVIKASGFQVHCAVCGESNNYKSRAEQLTAALAATAGKGEEADEPEVEEDDSDLASELDAEMEDESDSLEVEDAPPEDDEVDASADGDADDVEDIEASNETGWPFDDTSNEEVNASDDGDDETVVEAEDAEIDASADDDADDAEVEAASGDGWPFDGVEASSEDSFDPEDASMAAGGDDIEEISLESDADLVELDDLDDVTSHSSLRTDEQEPTAGQAPATLDNGTSDSTPSYNSMNGQNPGEDGFFLSSDADEMPEDQYEVADAESGDMLADVMSLDDTEKGMTLQASAGRLLALKGHIVVASLKKSDAGRNADVMMTAGFASAVTHMVRTSGMRQSLTQLGFKPVRIQTLTASAVHRKVTAAVTAATDSSQRKIVAMSESLAIAAAGLARGSWKGKNNPLQAAMAEELRALGAQNPERVAIRILSKSLVPFTKTLMEVAADLNSMSASARIEAARLLEMTEVTASPTEEDAEDETAGQSLESRLAATAAILPSVLTQEVQSVGRRDRRQQSIHASATATALDILDGRAPLMLG